MKKAPGKNQDFTPQVLLVNDTRLHSQVISDKFKKYFPDTNFEAVGSGDEALKKLDTTPPDLMLLDIVMPDRSGLEVLEIVKGTRPQIRVLMISVKNEEDPEYEQAFELGADDFVNFPFPEKAIEFRTRVKRLLAEIRNEKITKARLQEELKGRNAAKIDALKAILYSLRERDMETAEQLEELEHYADFMLRLWFEKVDGVITPETEEFIQRFKQAIIFHDIGKVGIEDEILMLDRRFEPYERERMERHVEIGLNIFDGIEPEPDPNSVFETIRLCIKEHQEKWDGTGYPHKLKGNDISFEGQWAKFLDSTHAILSRRRYKDPITFEKLVEIVSAQRGKEYSPAICDLFLQNAKRIETEFRRLDLLHHDAVDQDFKDNVVPISGE